MKGQVLPELDANGPDGIHHGPAVLEYHGNVLPIQTAVLFGRLLPGVFSFKNHSALRYVPASRQHMLDGTDDRGLS